MSYILGVPLVNRAASSWTQFFHRLRQPPSLVRMFSPLMTYIDIPDFISPILDGTFLLHLWSVLPTRLVPDFL